MARHRTMQVAPTTVAAPRRLALAIEWPTLAVAASIYGMFGLVTWFYQELPWWLVLPVGAYAVAWHGSLQHEVVHGHPTPWGWVNEALVFASLWLWLPFRLYRDSHLTHHRDEYLTDPSNDPESYYVSSQTWARLGRVERGLCWWLNTLSGRLVLGPARCVALFLMAECRRLGRGDAAHLAPWGWHTAGSAMTLTWVLWVCEIPLLAYLALFAYPGLSLTLLRSFLEHQANQEVARRTAVVEAGPVMSLLFLYNNLHALHHAEPGVAWYRLPGRYRQARTLLLERNGSCRFHGYGEVLARYLLWPKESPVHPFAEPPRQAMPLAAPLGAEPAA